jgi:hypothetical protein
LIQSNEPAIAARKRQQAEAAAGFEPTLIAATRDLGDVVGISVRDCSNHSLPPSRPVSGVKNGINLGMSAGFARCLT